MNRMAASAAVVLSLAACVEKATVPRAPEQILPMAVTSPVQELTRGQSVTFTVTITNVLDELVRLSFPSSCQARLYVKNSAGRVVAPASGYQCAAVPSLITLPAGQATTFAFQWSGTSELGLPATGNPLPAGAYYASAELAADGYTGIAYPILIVLRD